jgi:hypothetical protein
MFWGSSIKEMLAWIGGMLLAAALVILGVIFAVDRLVDPPNLEDPLTRQGGLKADQDVRQK